MHILITGGNEGIGFQMVLQFLRDGHKVAVFDLNLDNLSAYKEQYGENLIFFECDISNGQAVMHSVNEVFSVFNGIDYAIHNACRYLLKSFEDTADDDYKSVYNVNYYGAINLTRAVLPIMKKHSGGRFFYTCSVAGITGFAYDGAYASSKAALESLAKCLNLEYQNEGITFHIIHPPHTGTASVRRWTATGGYMNDPEKVGIGLAKNIHKKKFIICYSFSHYLQIKTIYLFPTGWGRFLNTLANQKNDPIALKDRNKKQEN